MSSAHWFQFVICFATTTSALASPHGPVPDVANWGAGNGLVSINLGSSSISIGNSAALTADHMLLIGGAASWPMNVAAIVRLRTDGSLDPAFGDGGLASFLQQPDIEVVDLHLASDGTIAFLAQTPAFIGGGELVWVGRLNQNGSLDTSFNGNGYQLVYATTFLNGVAVETPMQVMVQPDRKVIALMTEATQIPETIIGAGVARFTVAGAPDPQFGDSGVALYPADGKPPMLNPHMDLLANGKMVITAQAFPNHGFGSDFGIVQVDAAGNYDPTFGTAGWVFVPFDLGGGFTDAPTALTHDASGRILVGGTAEDALVEQIALTRLLPNGTLDRSFGVDGRVTTPLVLPGVNTASITITDVIALADGRILVGGIAAGTSWAAVFKVDGSFDTQFGTGGMFEQASPLASENQKVHMNRLLMDGDWLYMVGTGRNPTNSGADAMAAARYVLPVFNSGFDAD